MDECKPLLEGGCIPYSGGVVLDTSLMQTMEVVVYTRSR